MTGWLRAHPLSAAGLVVLAPLSVVLFAVAFLRASAPEVATLNTAGGAAATVAVTLISVEAALRLEERRRATREWREWQTRVLEEADQWSRGVVEAMEEMSNQATTLPVYDPSRSSAELKDQDWDELQQAEGAEMDDVHGLARKARFRDWYHEFEHRVEAWVAWLEDQAATTALSAMLKEVGEWQRIAEDDLGAVRARDYLPSLRAQAEIIRQRYAEAVPEQYRPAGG